MKVEFQPLSYREAECDLLAVPVFEDETGPRSPFEALNRLTQGLARAVLDSGEFKTELNRTCLIHRPPGLKARMLLLIGSGKKKDFSLACMRELAGTAVRKGRHAAAKSVAFAAPGGFPARDAARVVAEGALYGNYESDAYKTRDRKTHDVEQVLLLGGNKAPRRNVDAGVRRGVVIGEATNFARTLVNEPANVLTPARFAALAAEAGGKAGLEVEVLEREDLERLGMNTMLAVARGSDEPPKLLVVRIKGQPDKPKGRRAFWAFVGKGVTFDSGGISIKPSEKMEEMKADMAGGAAVLGAMLALAQLKPAGTVIGLVPLVENLPSGRAARPGDVVKSFLGKTVEIINTDAEGRLILADALAYARKLGANRLVDVATLTGACIVALGHINAGMMGTDQEIIDQLRSNCSVTGEKLWQLPLDPEYRKAIESDIADVKNVGQRGAGAITAAKFLQEFVEDTPWVHLDIAGVDFDTDGKPYAAKGGTGFGVRTLVQLML